MYTFLDTFCDKLQVVLHQGAIFLKWTKSSLHHTLLCKMKSSHFTGTIPKPQLTSERFIPQRQTALSATFVMWQLEAVCHDTAAVHLYLSHLTVDDEEVYNQMIYIFWETTQCPWVSDSQCLRGTQNHCLGGLSSPRRMTPKLKAVQSFEMSENTQRQSVTSQ